MPLVLLVLTASLCLPQAASSNPPARDARTGTIRILYVGDCFAYGRTPFNYFKEEPAFRVAGVPNEYLANPQRAMRLYVPRSYQDHTAKYDGVFLSDAPVTIFTTQLLSWFKMGVVEGGQGLVMIGGWNSFGGKQPYPSWSGSSVEDVLPVLCLDGQVWEPGRIFYPVPADETNSFCTSLPWKQSRPFKGMNIVQTREAATVVMGATQGPKGPLLVYWEVGRGSGMAHTSDLTPGWGEDFMFWEYYPDYVCNLVYLLTRCQVPQDPDLMHALRTLLHDYHQQRALVVSLMEFIERFGANTATIQKALGRIDEMKQQADRLYGNQDYEAVLAQMDKISTELARIEQDGLRLKSRALFWIFVIQWLVVSGTLMICGYVVWSLMVKRRLYREVATTKLEKAPNDEEADLNTR